MNTLIGIDFSLVKPAACIFHNNKYTFISWPYNLSDSLINLYKNSGVNIIERKDERKDHKNLSINMRYEIINSLYLSTLILNTFKELNVINTNTYIAFEGLSYGSSGNAILQLSSFKYMLMHKLSEVVSLDHMYTYSPITIKSVAGCAKKGMGKSNMIEAFIKQGPNCILRNNMIKDKSMFMKKGDKNWKDHLDDLIDSYWIIETLRNKENL